ncbi:MAG: M13 family metallopeptidase N-terminal domain-containing protein, partial [Patescibacteria group bacterium]
MKKRGWGFDVSSLDLSVRPQDDFFRFVNGSWLKRNPIPASESRWGSFIVLRHETDREVHALVRDVAAKRANSPEERLIARLFRSGTDMKRRNALGARPLAPLFERVEALRHRDELADLLGQLHRLGVDVPFFSAVDQDLRESSRYVLYFGQSGLGMPERDYYLKSGAEEKR